MGWNIVIFQKQRGEARTMVAVDAVLKVGAYRTKVLLTNASSSGVMATLANPPVRGTKVEVLIGDHVLPGQIRWHGTDCCGIALRDSISVADLIERGEVAISYIPERKGPRGPAAFFRAIVGS
jgi:hypothetical protein